MRSVTTRRFTLIELLTVMGIIAALTALLVGVSAMVTRNIHEARTKARLEAMMTALQEHYQDRGYYPQQTTAGDLNFTASAFVHSQTGRPYLEGYNGGPYLDGFQQPFQYQTGDRSTMPEGYHLWSKGKDMQTGATATEQDDICSWKQR
jgi:type II secretory pathway pseudopilin PulG